MKVPEFIPLKVTSSPPAVLTFTFPAPPTNNTAPLFFPAPGSVDILGISTVSLGVTAAAL